MIPRHKIHSDFYFTQGLLITLQRKERRHLMLPFYIILNFGFYDFNNNRTDVRLIRISWNNQGIQYLYYKNNISIINHNTSKFFSFLDARLKVSPIFFLYNFFPVNSKENLFFTFSFTIPLLLTLFLPSSLLSPIQACTLSRISTWFHLTL